MCVHCIPSIDHSGLYVVIVSGMNDQYSGVEQRYNMILLCDKCYNFVIELKSKQKPWEPKREIMNIVKGKGGGWIVDCTLRLLVREKDTITRGNEDIPRLANNMSKGSKT